MHYSLLIFLYHVPDHSRAQTMVFNSCVSRMLQVTGLGVLGIGIWMKIDPTIVNFLHVVNIDQSDALIDHAAMLFIIVGGLVCVVGFVGCVGAIRRSQLLLFVVSGIIQNTRQIYFKKHNYIVKWILDGFIYIQTMNTMRPGPSVIF